MFSGVSEKDASLMLPEDSEWLLLIFRYPTAPTARTAATATRAIATVAPVGIPDLLLLATAVIIPVLACWNSSDDEVGAEAGAHVLQEFDR